VQARPVTADNFVVGRADVPDLVHRLLEKAQPVHNGMPSGKILVNVDDEGQRPLYLTKGARDLNDRTDLDDLSKICTKEPNSDDAFLPTEAFICEGRTEGFPNTRESP
jgi:hypothetical protein